MRSSILFATCAFLLLQVTTTPAQQQPPKVRIEGTVVRAGTGEALPGARLTLARPGRGGAPPLPQAPAPAIPAAARGAVPAPKPIPPVVSDDQGKFAIPDLDEGTYTLQVLANGYVSMNYGQRFPGGPGTPLNVKAGQDIKDLAITLTPAGNVSGRVRDRSDQPLVDVPVQLMKYSYNNQGQRTYQTVGNAKTNDRGEYRIYWITPGHYYLMAGSPGSGSSALLALLAGGSGGAANANPNSVPALMGFTFYPGVGDISQARPIDLQPGAELDSMNLTLSPRPPPYRIRGRVIDSRTGQPPARARVASSSQTPGLSNGAIDQIAMELPINNYNAATGAFEIRDLLPGSYVVTAVAQDGQGGGLLGPVGAGQPGSSNGMTAVTIADSDVEGVAITVVPSATIPGRLRAEGQLPTTLDRIRIQLTPRSSGSSINVTGLPPGGGAVAAADGTFRIANISAGDYRVATIPQGVVTPAGARPGSNAIYIKEARFDGADVLNGPLRISGAVTGTMDIVLGIGGGQVSGVVTDRRSQPVTATQVVLVPDRVRDRTDLYRTSNTDDMGRFNFIGVIPGDYKVFSWDGLEQYGWFDPDLMTQSETKGVAVRVTDTSSEMVDVKLIPKEGAQ